MNNQELKSVLDLHGKWVMDDREGKRADLTGVDLRDADLRGADLRGADLIDANLRDADLMGADLRDADLRGANLIYADLRGAYLAGAYLMGADLMGADLAGVDLKGAYLAGAYLRDVDLRGADLIDANLSEIKSDFFQRLSLVKKEVSGLYQFVLDGKVDGDVYQGECACFIGSIANIAKENYNDLTSGLRPDSNSLTEKWFLAIKKGDTPENNPVSAIVADWLREFMNQENIPIPNRIVNWT